MFGARERHRLAKFEQQLRTAGIGKVPYELITEHPGHRDAPLTGRSSEVAVHAGCTLVFRI